MKFLQSDLLLIIGLFLTMTFAKGQGSGNDSDIKSILQARRKAKIAISPPRHIGGAIIFRDDFNSLDLTKWRHEVSMYGGFNNEFQVYTNDPRNSFTKDGYLYLKPTLTIDDPRFDENFLHHGTMDMKELYGQCTSNHLHGCHRSADKNGLNPPVMSAKLCSVPTLRYGVVEVRARISKGDWLWPAIWLKPRNTEYGHWPRSGEIDMMESRGNKGYFGVDNVSSALHWGPKSSMDGAKKTTKKRKRHSWASGFHTWRMEWTPDRITISVDNLKVLNVDPGKSFWDFGGFKGNNLWAGGDKMAPFDKDFYLILNVAVGGTNGMFNNRHIHKPWHSKSQRKAMEEFWDARETWEKTWVDDEVAMVVDYIEMRHL